MTESAEPTLAELGEFEVIDRLTSAGVRSEAVLIGPGDDAALLAVPDSRVLVSTDMLVEGRHFRLDWSCPHDLGRKAIAQNAADIEAMGARSSGFVVAFGAPADTPARLAFELFDGMRTEVARSGGAVVGGDLVRCPQWVISVTVLGELAGRVAVRRGGARVGSTVAVAGDLGRSAAGYGLLMAGRRESPELRNRHLVPEPPYGQGRVAADAGATAMIDTSDGLIADLRHVAAASGVGIELETSALVADLEAVGAAAEALGVDPWVWVLGGGEDHALVACFPGELPAGWRAIGTVVGGEPRVRVDGRDWTGYAGWESFN
jgi:thiamine-monophosphate kinase